MNLAEQEKTLRFETSLRFTDESWDKMIADRVQARISNRNRVRVRWLAAAGLILSVGASLYPLARFGEQDVFQVAEQWMSPGPGDLFERTVREEVGLAGFF